MPELPEVETARALIEGHALRRRIASVDQADPYVTRPHEAGQLAAALVGRRLTAVHRRGKSMWCDTSGVGRSRRPGPVLGIHLGMSGKIVCGDGRGHEVDGGDYWDRGRVTGDHRFTRFRLGFEGGSFLLLIDPRRLGRVRLDPPIEQLGPDALTISQPDFRRAFSRGIAPAKTRLLDQTALAGVGSLLADEALWQARLSPAIPVSWLSAATVDRLHSCVIAALSSAIAGGGVHSLPVAAARSRGAVCPRCGAPMAHGTVGGRLTWWCSREQS